MADAEIIRSMLVPGTNHDGRCTILGQSFGGFCCVTYLSNAPEGREVEKRREVERVDFWTALRSSLVTSECPMCPPLPKA